MNADADLQVWLETFFTKNQPAFVVPYVRSNEDTNLTYRLNTVQVSQSGRSVLNQSGSVDVQAGVPVALVRMALSREKDDECHIDVYLEQKNLGEQEYHFECPAPKDAE